MYELAGGKQDMRSLSTISYTVLVEGTLPANHMLWIIGFDLTNRITQPTALESSSQSSCHKRGTKKKILSPHEDRTSDLRIPLSDVSQKCLAFTEIWKDILERHSVKEFSDKSLSATVERKINFIYNPYSLTLYSSFHCYLSKCNLLLHSALRI